MATNPTSKFDPHFTQHVIDTMGPKTTPRTRQVIGSLIKHIHDFTRENEISMDEWMMGVQFINSIGQISTPTRNEGLRMSDVIGLESYVPVAIEPCSLSPDRRPAVCSSKSQPTTLSRQKTSPLPPQSSVHSGRPTLLSARSAAA